MNAEPEMLTFRLAEKIYSRHNDGQAFADVRQSTVRQVEQYSVPRTRGAEPRMKLSRSMLARRSPHTRG